MRLSTVICPFCGTTGDICYLGANEQGAQLYCVHCETEYETKRKDERTK